MEWTSDLDERMAVLWAEGTFLADIPKALGGAGPDAVTDRISWLRARGKWPDDADSNRKRNLSGVRCPTCEQRFADLRGLRTHVRVRHPGDEAPGRNAPGAAPAGGTQKAMSVQVRALGHFRCDECDYSASTREEVAAHRAAVHRASSPGPASAEPTPLAKRPAPVLRATYLQLEGEVDAGELADSLAMAAASMKAGRRYRVTVTVSELPADV